MCIVLIHYPSLKQTGFSVPEERLLSVLTVESIVMSANEKTKLSF